MILSKLRDDLINNRLVKSVFINEAYSSVHKILYEYANELIHTDISRIEISDKSVIMLFRSSNIKMKCLEYDERIAPIETINFKHYEKKESDMMLNLLDENSVVLDIGANLGYYSLLFSNQFPNTKVYAFEPVLKSYDGLQENIILNDKTNIKVYNFGFSDSVGVFDFYYYPEGSGNASMTILNEKENIEVTKCFVSTIDSFVASNSLEIDFIKCDVEGAELFVFKGGINSISKYKPIIFSEILRKWSAKFHYNPNEIIQLLQSLGYNCYTVHENKLKEFSFMDENTLETNFFFLHKEKHIEKILGYINA